MSNTDRLETTMNNSNLTDGDKRKLLLTEIRYITRNSTSEILKLCDLMRNLEEAVDQEYLNSLKRFIAEGEEK